MLERAARELYREWFVRLRFPGHEHVKIVDGVPEGWETYPSKISDVGVDYNTEVHSVELAIEPNIGPDT